MKRFLVLAFLVLLSSSAEGALKQKMRLQTGAISPSEVVQLQSEPLSLLEKYQEGGPPMAQYVARAVMTDASLIDPILSVADRSTPEQASAIGAGMARSARALGKKKSRASLSISEKISRIDNSWIKITFWAIGPNYNPNLAPSLPDLVPPPPLVYSYIGEELPATRSRIGDNEQGLPVGIDLDGSGRRGGSGLFAGRDGEILNRDVPITAILLSDSERNSTGSTSPTR